MTDPIFIVHSIFLTERERNLLTTTLITIDTVGMSVRGNTTDIDSGLTKLFVKYTITNEVSNTLKRVDFSDGGYTVSFPKITKFRRIKNVQQGGQSWMAFNIQNFIDLDGELVPVRHQVIFKDVSEQERITFSEQLGAY